jgi:ankyrin repeat protein
MNNRIITTITIILLSFSSYSLAGINLKRPDALNKDILSPSGISPLVKAALNDSKSTAKYLISKDFNVNACNPYGETALMAAAFSGSHKVAKLLIKSGANIDAEDKNGWTALSWALWARSGRIVQMLLRKGAKISAEDKQRLLALVNSNNNFYKRLTDFFPYQERQ